MVKKQDLLQIVLLTANPNQDPALPPFSESPLVIQQEYLLHRLCWVRNHSPLCAPSFQASRVHQAQFDGQDFPSCWLQNQHHNYPFRSRGHKDRVLLGMS